jgi:hypothetical protein
MFEFSVVNILVSIADYIFTAVTSALNYTLSTLYSIFDICVAMHCFGACQMHFQLLWT